ncbi:MAG: carbohydrate ABC transporter permease [Turicibacter sp.]|nr:carbohydrate ABC transporter permease [Turicibacter sp.]
MKESLGYKVFKVFNYSIITGFVFLCLYPFLQIIAESFSSESMIRGGHVNLIPRQFNTWTYQVMMSDPLFWINYRNTLVYTVVGVVISMILTTMAAYALSKKDLMGRGFFLFLFAFTMFFSGGLIPTFMLVRNFLGWANTIWAIVIPGAIGVFNILIMKTFFEALPKELEEAAIIDGCSQMGVFIKIILPLSKAVIATQVLFYAVGAWNAWFPALLYMQDRQLQPVAMYLRGLVMGANSLTTGAMAESGAGQQGVSQNVGAVAIILTSLPIISIYPFLQKYFVTGVTLGAVK